MGIKISQTYEIWDEDSISAGDTDQRGFDFEDADYEFRELVDKIKNDGFVHPSCSHGVPGWLSTDGDTDIHTGEREIKSLHPGRDRLSQKYWAKACKAAGVIRH